MRDIVTGGFKKKKATLQHVVCPASYAVGFFNIGWNNRSGWWSQALVERGRRRGEGGDGIAEEIVSVVVVVVVSRRLYRTNRWNTRKYLFSSCHEQATLPAFPTQAEADRYTWVYLGELPRNTTVGCTGTRSLSLSLPTFYLCLLAQLRPLAEANQNVPRTLRRVPFRFSPVLLSKE